MSPAPLTDQEQATIHQLPLPKVMELLVSTFSGLSEQEVQERLKRFGPNKLTEQKELSFLVKFLRQFNNFFSYLLLLGAALSLVSEWLQPGEGAIFIAVALMGVTVLNASFTFIQQHKAEKAMKSFKNLMTSKVVVLRQEERRQIDSTDLVPGDVMLLSEGDKITADARLFEITGLKVNHSALTGESEPLLRSTRPTSGKLLLSRNMVLSGTLVQSGAGKAVVVATGDDTQIGRIAGATRGIGIEASHMQREIGYFIRIISYIAIFLGVTFFLLGEFVVRNPFWTNIVFAIGIIVANVPEGLLPTVTLTLSLAAQRMAREQVLVKNIDSIETLGSVTIICSDKTGTLTENNLFVHGFYLSGVFYSYNREDQQVVLDSRTVNLKRLPGANDFNRILVLCNNSSFDARTGNSFGDPTEICLKQFVSSFDNVEYIEKLHPRTHEIPFTSETRYMITANGIDDHQYAHLKGAPQIVLEKCTHLFFNGQRMPLSDGYKEDILARNEEYAKLGFRVLGAALKDIPLYESEILLEQEDYCFYGLIVMQDPPRKEVPEAVRLCRQAGIRIFVISGDQEKTVENIARQTGILTSPTPKIVSGTELAALDDETLKIFLQEKEVIFARTLPRDKLRIVSLLKNMGEIVAVTGDGVNDAPALRKADVGIAMGRSGTEVAKEAADIVLLDDNFASIAHAIKSGRTVYENIKSFILYILTSNVPEIIPFLFFVLFSWPLALPVLLILCIDLGTDMLPAIGLGMEPSSSDIMNRKPRDPLKKILNWRMLARSYGFIGPLQTLFAYIIFFDILFSGGWSWNRSLDIADPLYRSALTAFFSSVVVTQIFNVFACRTSRTSVLSQNLLPNRIILSGIGAEILMLLLLTYLPPFQFILGTSPFSPYYYGWMIGFGAVILLCEEGRKYFNRHFDLFDID